MTLQNWLLLIHILCAMAWLGGGLMLCLIALRVRRSRTAILVRDLSVMLEYAGLRIFMPSVILLAITGLWMVIIGPEFHFSQPWVISGIVLFVLVFLIGAIYQSRAAIRFKNAAHQDDMADSLQWLNRWLIGYGLTLLLLLVATADMVFKPGI